MNNTHTVLQRVILLIAVASLAGCNASMPTIPFTKPTAQLIEDLRTAPGSEAVVMRTEAQRVPRSTVNLQAPNSVIVDARTEAYVKQILSELMVRVPPHLQKEKTVDVFITSHQGSTHLYATGVDDILIGIDSLDTFNSRDELAFALAHELSHIVLSHNDGQESIFSLDSVVKLMDKASVMALTYKLQLEKKIQNGGQKHLTAEEKREMGEHVNRIKLSVAAIRSSIVGVLHGAWSRRQERDADRLGYDLLIEAGYNGEAPGLLLDTMAETPSLRENVARHIDTIEESARALVDLQGKDDSVIERQMKRWGISSLATLARSAISVLDDTHKNAEERKKDLYEDYVDELELERNIDRRIDKAVYTKQLKQLNYAALKKKIDDARNGYLLALTDDVDSKDRARYTSIVSGQGGAISFNRFVLASIRAKMGENGSASKNLQIAYANRPEDFATTAQYALVHASKGQVDSALKVVDFLEKTYSNDAPLNDVRGEIYAEAGNLSDAKRVLNDCDANKKSYVRERCEIVLNKIEAEEEQAANADPDAAATASTQTPLANTGGPGTSTALQRDESPGSVLLFDKFKGIFEQKAD
ncbi:MAG: M48 family metalloprotease [Gammaproteobacteria bacterium]|nr:M48 family metalloprotease [Gammaproteobacteria bacterium]MCP5415636.1 M48 family metalloprotease [Chromatiaceae bacterium]